MPQNTWSRRRAAVQAEAEAESRAVAEQAVAVERAGLEEKTDGEILTELDLKDPDDMQAGDDFSAFMKSAVPERLRRRALRKLWLSDPILANVDGLVDYGDDFTDAATVIEGLKTSYQVGRGLLKHVEEMERQKAEKEAGDAVDETDEDGDELLTASAEEIEELPDPAPLCTDAPETYASLIDQDNDDAQFDEKPDVMVKSRMQFSFADE